LGLQSVFNGLVPRATTTWVRVRELGGGCSKEEKGRLKSLSSEVGLAGEVRPAPRGQDRLKEAAKLGFSMAVVPKANAPKKPIEGLTVHAVDRIEQAIETVRGLG